MRSKSFRKDSKTFAGLLVLSERHTMTMMSSQSIGRRLLLLIAATILLQWDLQNISFPSSLSQIDAHLSYFRSQNAPYWTVMVTVSDGYYDFLLNWLFHFERLNLNVDLIVIAEDNLVKAKLEARELASNIRIEHSGLDLEPKAFQYGNTNFKVLMATRATHILKELRAGSNLIFSDIDTVWRLNPLPYFETDEEQAADMMIQVDKPEASGFKPFYCAGFMAVKSNERTIQMMLDWEAALKEKPQHNQPKFNEIVHRKSSVKHRALPLENFPSGNAYFEKFNDMQREKVVVVHNILLWGTTQRSKDLYHMVFGTLQIVDLYRLQGSLFLYCDHCGFVHKTR